MKYYTLTYVLSFIVSAPILSMETHTIQSKQKSKKINLNTISFAKNEHGKEDVLLVVKNPVYNVFYKKPGTEILHKKIGAQNTYKNPLYNPHYGKHSSQNENIYLLRDDKSADWRTKEAEDVENVNEISKNTVDSQKMLAFTSAKNYLKAHHFSNLKIALEYATNKSLNQEPYISSKLVKDAQSNLVVTCIEEYQAIKSAIEKIKEAGNHRSCDECDKDAREQIAWHGCDKKKLFNLQNTQKHIKDVWGYLITKELIPKDTTIEQKINDVESFGRAYGQTLAIKTLAETRANPENIERWKRMQAESTKGDIEKKS